MSKITVTTIAGLTSGGDANTVKIESGDAFNVVSGVTTLNGGVVLNENSADVDFRVESDANTHALFLEGSTGNIGIGTSSPPSYGSTFTVLQANNTGSGIVQANNSTNSVTTEIESEGTRGAVGTRTNHNFVIKTNQTERARIDTSGNVGIGQASPSQKLHLTSTASNTFIQFSDSGSGGSAAQLRIGCAGNDLIVQNNTGSNTATTRMQINSGGSLNVLGVYNDTTSGSANINVASDGHIRRSTSSKRYKNTITDATHGLTKLLSLRSVTFKGNNDGDTVFGGLIAEEVHDAGLTEFVQYDDDNKPDALAYGNMVSLCIKAIQELTAKVETLETKVEALESK